MPYTVSEQKDGVELHIEAGSLNDVFMDGARALFALLSDASEHLKDDERVKIVVDAKDIPSLFTAWLKELADRSEQHDVLFGECSIASIQKINNSQYLLTGAAYGEPFDKERHQRKMRIKEIKKVSFKEEGGKQLASCVCVTA